MNPFKTSLLAAVSTVALAGIAGQPAQAEVRVGVTSAVNPSALSKAPGRGVRTITLGDEVIHNEVINTNGAGLVQILLADGTTFTVGPNSSLTIDSFVYDPAAGTAKVSASLTKGFMRFIGGRTSKTPDGATIKTPIGTAGIRGAVVDINLGNIGQGGQQGGTPPHVSLIFGRDVTLNSNGMSNRLFKAGYSIIVDGGARSVTRTPPGFLQAMQGQLASRNGANGGAQNPPQDSQVRASGVAQHNSDSSVGANVPVPTPRPTTSSQQASVEEAHSNAVETAAGNVPRDNGATPVVRTAAARVLTGRPVYRGGGNGIVGGSRWSDRTGTHTGTEGGDGTVTLPYRGGTYTRTFSLPVYADSAFGTRSVSNIGYRGAAYSGTAYVGLDGFRAYMLTSGQNPLYVISGTPTANVATAFSTPGIRHYSLSADPLNPLASGAGMAVPFADGSRLVNVDMTNAVSSDLMIGATPGAGETVAKGLQSWIVINGTGPGQQSAIGVTTGTVSLQSDGVSYGFNGTRGGSDRIDSGGDVYSASGTVASAAGGSGGSSIFGPNGEYLVLTNDLDDGSSAFSDTVNGGSLGMGIGGGLGNEFATAHVGNLTSTDTVINQNYDGKTLNGFSSINWVENGSPTALAGTVEMNFDAANGSFDAIFKQFDDDGDLYNDELGFADSYGEAVYLDDDNFASAGRNNRSYVVNSKVAAAKIFDNGTSSKLCDCEYLSWGWWGQSEKPDGLGTSGHMGNWIVGDVTRDVDMPMSGTATYTGNAVGSVINGDDQYIATGGMTATMDFAARNGNVAITNFDGRDFGNSVSFGSGGSFASSGGTTAINGSFVNGNGMPAQGVIGAFATSDGNWSASGIFGGNRDVAPH